MLDRIVISILLGLMGALAIWCVLALVAFLNTLVPWYGPAGAAILIAVGAFIIDIRTRTSE